MTLLAGYGLCQSMLHLCGQHEDDGKCGVSQDKIIHDLGDHVHADYEEYYNHVRPDYDYEQGDERCEVVKAICLQVNEDTLYSKEYDEIDQSQYERKLNTNLDVYYGRI